MVEERGDAVTFKGGPITLVGSEVKAGDSAPAFTTVGAGLKEVTLADSDGKVRLISVVPSVDTPVCDQQTRRFNEEAAGLGDDVAILTISMDLPMAQGRYCGAAGIEQVTCLSDHRDASFGTAYGTLIKELRLLTRAIFVVGKDNTVKHVEYVSEVTEHPDYDAAIAAAKAAL